MCLPFVPFDLLSQSLLIDLRSTSSVTQIMWAHGFLLHPGGCKPLLPCRSLWSKLLLPFVFSMEVFYFNSGGGLNVNEYIACMCVCTHVCLLLQLVGHLSILEE